MTKHSSFNDYSAAQSEEVKYLLNELRTIILDVLPNAIESFSYGVPSFELVPKANMKQKIMIGGFKHHVGLYPHPDAILHFQEQLSPYKTSKGTIQFQVGVPLPRKLIQDIVTFRMKIKP
ncbi:MAG: DUF1801 domain-containing protein [Bacilli bacterium]|nr:DUF1801 domain-containing protein [Bacilli bacterium]